jgi:hypothetical protein
MSLALAAAVADIKPHVLMVVGDDVGYADFGALNGGKTITPTIDGLLASGVMLADYYTFKICRCLAQHSIRAATGLTRRNSYAQP